MGVDLHEWLDVVSRHRLKFKFEGLENGRRDKDDYFKTVGEAAAADEGFMSNYLSKEFVLHSEDFDAAVKAREDQDEYLSRFCSFAEHRLSAKRWNEHGFTFHGDWAEAPLDDILKVVDAFEAKMKDDYISDWVVGEASQYWPMIRDPDNAAELLEKHPPMSVWDHAGGSGIDVDDVFFICPTCGGQPQTIADLIDMHGTHNDLPRFYCGCCGAEAQTGLHYDLIDFFNDFKVTPFPFNAKRRAEWEKLKADRKALGDNKLNLKPGDKVLMKTSVQVPYHNNAPGCTDTWTNWRDEPGELVTITSVTNTTTRNGDTTTCAGVVTAEHGFVEFEHIFGRPKEPVPT